MPHTGIVQEDGNTPNHGQYGAVELGQGEEGATISVFRRQQHQEGGRGSRGKVGVVIAALVAVVLTAVAFTSNTSSSDASPARLMSPSPTSPTAGPGNDVAGNSPKAPTAWQNMVPKDVLTITSFSSSKGNTTASSKPVAGGPARKCTLDECKTYSGCDPATFPFVCVGGFAKGGCAKVQSAWEHPGCSDFCTLAGCAAAAPTCGQCSPEDCHKVQSVCGANRRYA